MASNEELTKIFQAIAAQFQNILSIGETLKEILDIQDAEIKVLRARIDKLESK